jgi:glucose-6-phosphate 1-epimerase
MGTAAPGSFRQMQNSVNASVVKGNGGLQVVRIECPQAAGEMYLHGAHVTSWKPAGREEVLFLSSRSLWEDGRAIRGGIPICFPWFGNKADDPKAPAHGFVRTKSWQLESIAQVENGIRVSMFTESDEGSRRWWPGDFHLAYRVTFGEELVLELVMTNTGKTAQRSEEALHTYHKVGNVLKARVAGLDRVEYIDKMDSNRKKIQNGEIAVVSETDRVYLNTSGAIEVEDAQMRRRTRVSKENSRTTVVWNPWVQKAQSMPDFGDNEWMNMICIETSNVADFAVDLAPGQRYSMKAIVRVEDF